MIKTLKSGFNPRPVHLETVVVKVALRQIFLTLLRLSLFSVSPPVLRAHPFINLVN